MSASEVNPVLRRLGKRYDHAKEQLDNYFERSFHGEDTDPAQFMALVQKSTVTLQAMEAQLKLHEKGKNTAMNDVK